MNMPDRRFPWIWTAWVVALVISFALLEGWAIEVGGTTLSRYVYELSKAFPLFTWLVGVLMGGLAVHFFWHWAPPGSDNEG